MKKSFKVVLIVAVILAMCFAIVGCADKKTDTPTPTPTEEVVVPDFSLECELNPYSSDDGVLILTNKDFADVALTEFSYKDTVYKGYRLSDVVGGVECFKNISVNSIMPIGNDGFGYKAMLSENFTTAYLAVVSKDGEGKFVGVNGGMRVIDLSANYIKGVKSLAKIYINQPNLVFVKEDGSVLDVEFSTSVGLADLATFTRVTKKGTVYYKGITLESIINANTVLSALNITSVKVDDGSYAVTVDTANFARAGLALYSSAQIDGEYSRLSQGGGPFRLVDEAQNTDFKNTVKITVVVGK